MVHGTLSVTYSDLEENPLIGVNQK